MPSTPATFTPPNVTMLNAMEGGIPVEQGTAILKQFVDRSALMQLGKVHQMRGLKTRIPVYLSGVGAYWVGEGQRIETSKPTWGEVTLEAKKLGVIIPVTREYLHYTASDFFEEIKPAIVEAFHAKFDAATILGVDSPYAQSIDALATGDRLIEGELNMENVDALNGAINDAGHVVNGYVSKTANLSLMRGLIRNADGLNERAFDANSAILDGAPVVNVSSTLTDMAKGTLYAGDFNNVLYGIPYGISYEISKDATLTSLVGEDGATVNLFEREMMALRATMDIAFAVIREDAFGAIKAPAVGP